MANYDALSDKSALLKQALLEAPFPVRGWFLEPLVTGVASKLWPLYKTVPKTDHLGRTLPMSESDIEEHLYLAETKIEAKFKFTNESLIIQGRNIILGPEIVQKQIVHFLDRQNTINITLDPSKIKTYSGVFLTPEYNSFHNCVERWTAAKKNAANGSDALKASWILLQLSKIKENALSAISQGCGTLVSTVRNNEPDYWNIIEGLMDGSVSPEQGIEKGKGAITISISERYRTIQKERQISKSIQ